MISPRSIILKIISPPVFVDEEKTLGAFHLYGTLWAVMLAVVLMMTINIAVLPENTLRWLMTIVAMVAPSPVSLALIRRGHIRLVAGLLAAQYWLLITAMALTGGGISAPEAPAYVLLVFGVGFMLGERAGVAMTAVCALTGLGLVWAERSGHLPVSMVHYTLFSRWVTYGFYMAVIVCLQYLASHTIRDSLQRARQELEERNRAEIALQTEKEYAEKLIQTANAIVVGLDTKGKITVFNQAAEEITGYTRAELTNKNWFDVVVPRDRYPETWAEFERLSQGGLPIRFENPILTKCGEERYIVWQNAALYEQSRIVGSISFGMDITEQKRAEEALLASEARFKAQYQGSPIPTTTRQKKGETFELVDYNQAAEIAGKGEAIKYLGKTTDEMFQDRPEMLKNVHRCFTEKEVIQAEFQSKHIMPGRTLATTYAFVPPDLVMMQSEDITERKRAEEALLASEARFKALYQGSPIPTVTWQKKGETFELVDYNQAAEIAGKGEAIKYLGKTTDEIYQDRPEILENMHRCFTRKAVIQREMQSQYFMPGRTIVNTYAFVPPDLIMVQAEDITVRKRAEEALYESEEKYRNIVENSLAGVYIVQDNLFRFVNKRWCEIFGYTYEEAVDTLGPIDTAYHEDRKIVEENIKKRLFGEASHIEYDFRAMRKDGKVLNLKVLGSATIYKGRKAITGNVIDITREKTLESQLHQAHKMEAIGTMAGGIAHDFNNILTVLSGYGTLLQMKMDKDNPLRIYVDQILSASQGASNLTRSLLAFSRDEPVTLRPVNINDILKGTEKLLKRLISEDITLKILLAPEDIIVMADATQIDQILFNLTTNAKDAMTEGGILTIETRLAVLDKEFIRIPGFSETLRYALLSVSDTGTGMDETIKEKLFEPFFTTKEVGKGTGLGLSTVYGIVKQHLGHITVYSEPNMGTVFHIYFPAVNLTMVEEKPSPEHIKRGKETILVAEDNKAVRRLMKDVLKQHGYTVIGAVDGDDAVNKFSKHKEIGLAILDSVMPKKNGREVYDEISKIRPHIKALFTSGYTRDVVLNKGIRDREFDFIAKPLSPNELLLKVREMLDR